MGTSTPLLEQARFFLTSETRPATERETPALGTAALLNNTTGFQNTAVGSQALSSNTTGAHNTANGASALSSNTQAGANTAIGCAALLGNTIGGSNTAVGNFALDDNETGNANTAIGSTAGGLITGSGNVCIGEGIPGEAGISSTTWIRNVYASVATARAVYVNSDNKIGTLSSSRRYKEEIKAMDKASQALFALKPVTFRYKKEIDRLQVRSFGLIAEEVADVSPDLITRDEQGKPQTVRYEAVNAMLLNEFQEEHRKNKAQEATIVELKSTVAQQQKQIEALTAGLQKVSAQLELNQPAPEVAKNNQ